jgi:hypothetical protein
MGNCCSDNKINEFDILAAKYFKNDIELGNPKNIFVNIDPETKNLSFHNFSNLSRGEKNELIVLLGPEYPFLSLGTDLGAISFANNMKCKYAIHLNKNASDLIGYRFFSSNVSDEKLQKYKKLPPELECLLDNN